MNQMIENAKKAKFQLPVFVIPFVAFGLNLIADIAGGALAIEICSRLKLSGASENRILLLSAAINALIIFLWIRFIGQRKIITLGLGKRFAVKNSLIGAAAGTLSFALILGAGCMLTAAAYQSIDGSAANTAGVLLMIPFWVIQAGAEELLTRGWVLPEVAAKSNRLAGVLVSSVLFVLMHFDNAGMNVLAVVNIFLIGVLLALYTLKSDSLWGAIMFHAFWNFTQGSVFGMSVSGGSAARPSLMNFISKGNLILGGGKFGIEASIITTVVIALLLAALLLADKAQIIRTMLLKHGNAKTAR